MKYETTNKHPELKEGLILEYWSDSSMWVCGPSKFYKVMVNQLEALLEKGYIKEEGEPEFTKSDMIDFANNWHNHYSHHCAGTETAYNDWIKNRDK